MGLSKCGSGSKQAAVSMYVLLLGLHTTYKIRPCLFSYLDFFLGGGIPLLALETYLSLADWVDLFSIFPTKSYFARRSVACGAVAGLMSAERLSGFKVCMME